MTAGDETGAGAGGGVPDWAKSAWGVLRRPRVADCLVTALALFLSLTSSVKNPLLGPAEIPWINHGLAGAVSLTLLGRRRFPEAVAVVALAGYVVHAASFVCLFAFYAVGAHRGRRNRLRTRVTALLGVIALAPWQHLPHAGLTELLRWLLFNVPLQVLLPLVIGLYVGARRAVMAALVERAERAEREQLLIAEAARVEERTRIAGEMHDVVSHQVSLMVVHANALEAMAHDPKVTAEAAATIRTAGRQALNELREMIGVLRRDPDGAGARRTGESPGAHGERDVDQGPQRALDGIAALVDTSRAAGLKAVLRVEGEPCALPDPAERAAYRVVQEALTNVHKHAAGAEAEVGLDYGASDLSVTVTNSRPAPAPESTPGCAAEPLLPSGGHGLIGLGERVRLAGGTIDSGPLPDGGFRVGITLPIPARAPAAASK